MRPHPDAQSLSVCTVNGGKALGSLQVVCGATNLRSGMLTALAPLGSSVTDHAKGVKLPIKAAKARGVESSTP